MNSHIFMCTDQVCLWSELKIYKKKNVIIQRQMLIWHIRERREFNFGSVFCTPLTFLGGISCVGPAGPPKGDFADPATTSWNKKRKTIDLLNGHNVGLLDSEDVTGICFKRPQRRENDQQNAN